MTPTNPQWVTDSIQGHTGLINDFAKKDPYSFVAGPNATQQKAWDLVGGLKPSTPNLASQIKLAGPSTFGGVQIGDMERAKASQGAQYMDAYRNPYTEQVVDTSLAGYDENAGRVRAQQAAQGAANGAFGGSRFALREAQTEGELGRERASLEAGLRSNAFNTAAGYGMADADRFGQVDMFNAGQGNQRTLSQANLDAQTGMFNTGAQNQFALTQAQMDAQNAMFNAQQQDQAQQRELQQLGMMGDMGNQQWQIEQTRAQAPVSHMAALSGMHAANPYALFSGRNITGTQQGTQTSTQPGGIGMGLLGGLSNMISFAPIKL